MGAKGPLNDKAIPVWLADLKALVAPHRILLHKPVGNGFFYVKIDSRTVVDRMIQVQLHRFPGGEACYHQWQLGFSPHAPVEAYHPYWLSLEGLPLELIPFLQDIVAQLGQILTTDIPNSALSLHCYCIALDLTFGWVSNLRIHNSNQEVVDIHISYEDP